MRKVIQVFVSPTSLIGALCDDGTIWLRENNDSVITWRKVDLSPLNQEEEAA